MSFQTNELLNSLVNEAATNLGYTIYSSRVYYRSGQTVIDVRIDNNDVISHQDCTNYSAELGRLIENVDNELEYYLEVSSPGLNRELRSETDYRRFINSKIKVKYQENDNVIVSHGTLLSVTGDIVEIKIDNKVLHLRFADILKTNLDY